MTRNQQREKTFCLIFEKSFKDDSCEEILELAESISEFELTEYTKDLFIGVLMSLGLVLLIIV